MPSAAAGLLTLLTACGGSGSTSASPAGSPSFNDHGSTTVSGSSVDVEADNYYFEPSVIRGTPGQKVSLALKNSSGTEHNFTIKDQHVDVDLDAHESKTVTVTIPSSGLVSFYCEYHKSHGMAGVIRPT